MRLPEKARKALDRVVEQFKAGDLSPVVEVAKLKRQGDVSPADSWSFSNQVLAFMQTGDLDCRGYRQWRRVDRHVKRGERAAYILGPCLYTKEDQDTGETRQVLRGFRGIPVFGVSQTEGADLPKVDYAPAELPPLSDVAQALGIEVQYRPLPSDRLGSCSVDGKHINLGTHDNVVFFHELGHAVHARLNGKLQGGQHNDQEVVAEFTATVLAALYGEDHTGLAWARISSYARDPLTAIVKAMGTVEQIVAFLTNGEVK